MMQNDSEGEKMRAKGKNVLLFLDMEIANKSK
jgi:hypothetical protein